MSMKNSNDTIWDRTSELPICSTGPHWVNTCEKPSAVVLIVKQKKILRLDYKLHLKQQQSHEISFRRSKFFTSATSFFYCSVRSLVGYRKRGRVSSNERLRNCVHKLHTQAQVCNIAPDKVLYEVNAVCFHLENPRQLRINCHSYHLALVFSQLHHLKRIWLSVTSKLKEQKLHLHFQLKATLPSTCYGTELLLFHSPQQQYSTRSVTLVVLTSGRSRHSFNPICDVSGIEACVYSMVKKEVTAFMK